MCAIVLVENPMMVILGTLTGDRYSLFNDNRLLIHCSYETYKKVQLYLEAPVSRPKGAVTSC